MRIPLKYPSRRANVRHVHDVTVSCTSGQREFAGVSSARQRKHRAQWLGHWHWQEWDAMALSVYWEVVVAGVVAPVIAGRL